jgi:RNA polymerase sigma-70 factor (ECF subfamily)
LITRARGGDQDAVATLLRRAAPKLHERLLSEIGASFRSQLDPEDVLQVTFLECFLKIPTFEYRGEGSFEAWLSTICHHNLLDAIRELQRAGQLPTGKRVAPSSDSDTCIALWDLLGATSGTPSRQVAAEELHLRVRQAVAQLPRDYARVLTLYDLESRPIEDVAGTMNRTPGAIYMLRARALDFLRETLGSESRM